MADAVPAQDDYRNAVIISVIILLLCSSSSVLLKIVRSWYVAGSLNWQDGFLIMAVACAAVMSTLMAVTTTSGLGMHDDTGSIVYTAAFQRPVITINVFYLACNMFVKLGLLLMYASLTRSRYVMWTIYSMQILSVIFGVGSIFSIIFQCVPVSANWDPTIEASCIDLDTFYYANASIMIGMDIILYVLPMYIVWQIQLTRARKYGLCLLFATGFVVVASSCVRLYIVHEVLTEGDMPYQYARALIASAVENHLAIFIACAPSIQNVLKQFVLPKVLDVYYNSRDRFSKLRTRSSTSTNNYSDEKLKATFESDTVKSSTSTMNNKIFSGIISPLGWVLKRSGTTNQESRDPDIENMHLDFHDNVPNPLPMVHTLIAKGPTSPRPQSSKDRIYVTKEVTVSENYNTDTTMRSFYDEGDADADAKSTESKNIDEMDACTISDILVVPSLDDDVFKGSLPPAAVAGPQRTFGPMEKTDEEGACDCHPGTPVTPTELGDRAFG